MFLTPFSNSFIIHELKTKKIITVTEVSDFSIEKIY